MALLAIAIALPSIATAERDFPFKRLDRLLAEHAQLIDIDPELREVIRDLYAHHRSDTETAREALHIAHKDLDGLLEGDPGDTNTVDTDAIDIKIDEIGALRTELQKAKVWLRLSIRGALTPEQQRALSDVLNHRKVDRKVDRRVDRKDHRNSRHKMRRAQHRRDFREMREDG